MYRVYELIDNEFRDMSPSDGFQTESAAVAVATMHYRGFALAVIRGGLVWSMPAEENDWVPEGFWEE